MKVFVWDGGGGVTEGLVLQGSEVMQHLDQGLPEPSERPVKIQRLRPGLLDVEGVCVCV